MITRDANMIPVAKLDAAGKPVPFHVDYPTNDASGNFLTHPNAKSVIGLHKFQWMFVQATVAILILVGFESVTSMGGEAQQCQAGRADCRDHFATGSGGVLLPVRVFRRKLLS